MMCIGQSTTSNACMHDASIPRALLNEPRCMVYFTRIMEPVLYAFEVMIPGVLKTLLKDPVQGNETSQLLDKAKGSFQHIPSPMWNPHPIDYYRTAPIPAKNVHPSPRLPCLRPDTFRWTCKDTDSFPRGCLRERTVRRNTLNFSLARH
jgi:hypothetical protein